jgi:tetratricopeptide (TPR) repeat protein
VQSRARAHFEAGRALYSLGSYTDAVREFTAGYQLVPNPTFLINLAQAYRKLDDLPKARAMFEKFLAEAPTDDPYRPQSEQLLKQIGPAPPSPAPLPEPAARLTPPPTPDRSAPPPPPRRFLRRHWWIIPVSIAAAAGLAVGIYFAARPSDPCGPATLGCLAAPAP